MSRISPYVSIGLFLSTGLFFTLANAEQANQSAQVQQVDQHLANLQFVSVKEQNVSREQVVEGVIEAVNKATLKAQTSGQIEAVNFDVYDFVEQGQLLVRIKADEQTASTAQIKAQVAEARAYFNQAKTEYNRINKIFKSGALSASRRDQARADLNAARARLNAAVAATKRSTIQQEYTEIKAPYSGVVVERHIEQGEVANIGSPIMTGMSLDQLRVVTQVSQSQITAVREHQKARVFVTDSQGDVRSYAATRLTIAPQANEKSHTFRVRVDLPEKIPGLYPGMYVKVAFTVGEEKILLIPQSAVAYRGEVRGIYVKNQQGDLSMSPVRIGSKRDADIEVLSGAMPGDQIALDPVAAAVAIKAQFAAQARIAQQSESD